jgi:protein-S-isoprenylcysteine O-methyltransferase Ste14
MPVAATARTITDIRHPPPMFIARIILFTLLLPGTFTVIVPYAIIATGQGGQGRAWTPPQWLGLLPIGVGAGMLLWCILDFARLGRGTLAPIDPPTVLVVRGLYRYVRNPMYVSVMLILLGEYVLFGTAGLLINLVCFFSCTHGFVVFYEEPDLRRRFGQSYVSYCSQVHRWLPLIPRE